MEVLRCTHCDPLYMLEPMAFGEDCNGISFFIHS